MEDFFDFDSGDFFFQKKYIYFGRLFFSEKVYLFKFFYLEIASCTIARIGLKSFQVFLFWKLPAVQ